MEQTRVSSFLNPRGLESYSPKNRRSWLESREEEMAGSSPRSSEEMDTDWERRGWVGDLFRSCDFSVGAGADFENVLPHFQNNSEKTLSLFSKEIPPNLLENPSFVFPR